MTILLLRPTWVTPVIDWHAIAPELVLIVGINIVLASDLLVDESRKWATASLTGFVLLGAAIPLVTLAVTGDGASAACSTVATSSTTSP